MARCPPYLALGEPIAAIAEEKPCKTRYRLSAYPNDARQQFRFATDLSLRAKAKLLRQGFRIAAVSARPEPAKA